MQRRAAGESARVEEPEEPPHAAEHASDREFSGSKGQSEEQRERKDQEGGRPGEGSEEHGPPAKLGATEAHGLGVQKFFFQYCPSSARNSAPSFQTRILVLADPST